MLQSPCTVYVLSGFYVRMSVQAHTDSPVQPLELSTAFTNGHLFPNLATTRTRPHVDSMAPDTGGAVRIWSSFSLHSRLNLHSSEERKRKISGPPAEGSTIPKGRLDSLDRGLLPDPTVLIKANVAYTYLRLAPSRATNQHCHNGMLPILRVLGKKPCTYVVVEWNYQVYGHEAQGEEREGIQRKRENEKIRVGNPDFPRVQTHERSRVTMGDHSARLPIWSEHQSITSVSLLLHAWHYQIDHIDWPATTPTLQMFPSCFFL